jgi:hypothetical protein
VTCLQPHTTRAASIYYSRLQRYFVLTLRRGQGLDKETESRQIGDRGTGSRWTEQGPDRQGDRAWTTMSSTSLESSELSPPKKSAFAVWGDRFVELGTLGLRRGLGSRYSRPAARFGAIPKCASSPFPPTQGPAALFWKILGRSWGHLGAILGYPDLGVFLGWSWGGPGRSRWESPNRTGPKREAHLGAEFARHREEKQIYKKRHFYNSAALMQISCSYLGNITLRVLFTGGKQK